MLPFWIEFHTFHCNAMRWMSTFNYTGSFKDIRINRSLSGECQDCPRLGNPYQFWNSWLISSSTSCWRNVFFLTKIFCKGRLRLTVANIQGGLSHTTGTPCKGFLRRRHTDAVFVTKLDRLPAWCVFPTLTAVFVERQKNNCKERQKPIVPNWAPCIPTAAVY